VRYASVCDGIGAVHVAWQGLQLECAWRSEIERFPEAVVSHRFPNIGPNLGDMTKITDEEIARHGPIDLLVGGTPCQSFSVAGLRRGLADPRGNLALAYLALASRSGARWLLWENVPGVLSSNGGRDFGAFLGGLAELGYGFAYRVLDARHFGVPQRRRRVFVVGHLGDWRRAAAVLFERESLRGDLEAGGEEGEDPAAGSGDGAASGGDAAFCVRTSAARMMWDGADNIIPQHARCVTRGEGARGDFETTTMIPVAIPIQDGREIEKAQNGLGVGRAGDPAYSLDTTGAQAIAFNWQSGGDCRLNPRSDGVDALQRCQTPAVAFTQNQRDEVRIVRNVGALAAEPGMKQQTYIAQAVDTYNGAITGRTAATLGTGSGTGLSSGPSVMGTMGVRRLTPRECERLQGFPDDYTLVPYRGKLAADGPRYKGLGNSMAVPVMRYIGERLVRVDALAVPR